MTANQPPRRQPPSPVPAARHLPLLRLLASLGPLLVALLVSGCDSWDSEAAQEEPLRAPAVEALPAESGALPLEEQVSGAVRAKNQVEIRPEISAPVTAVLVQSGDQVRPGQPLVRLDDRTLRDQLRQTEASLRLARGAAAEARARVAEVEAQVTRSRTLAAEDLISAMELETQEAQLDAAQANAEQAAAQVDEAEAAVAEGRSALDRAVVRAPVTGRVGRREVEVGMLAEPSDILFTLGSPDELVVEVPLTERMLATVEEGDPVVIHAASLAEPLEARLTRISPFLESRSFSTEGEIEIDNPGGRLRPGMFVDVSILYGQSERATLVPTTALTEDPTTGERGIFVVRDAAGLEPGPTVGPDGSPADVPEAVRGVELRPVGIVAEGRAAVGVTGVEPGEWVVVVGQHLLERSADATARVRPTSWERVLELQGLQREDLLAGFLAKQRRLAEEIGVEPPSNEEIVGEAAPTEGEL